MWTKLLAPSTLHLVAHHSETRAVQQFLTSSDGDLWIMLGTVARGTRLVVNVFLQLLLSSPGVAHTNKPQTGRVIFFQVLLP